MPLLGTKSRLKHQKKCSNVVMMDKSQQIEEMSRGDDQDIEQCFIFRKSLNITKTFSIFSYPSFLPSCCKVIGTPASAKCPQTSQAMWPPANQSPPGPHKQLDNQSGKQTVTMWGCNSQIIWAIYYKSLT